LSVSRTAARRAG